MVEGPVHPLESFPLGEKSKDWPQTLQGRIDRMRKIADTTAGMIRKWCPCLLLIEGYAFAVNPKRSRAVSLAELGMLLRDRVVGYADNTVEVPPSTVKKFATGKGNANKTAVATHLAKRYKISFKDDNESDCFGILRLGHVVVGYESAQTQFQTETAEVVRTLIERESA